IERSAQRKRGIHSCLIKNQNRQLSKESDFFVQMVCSKKIEISMPILTKETNRIARKKYKEFYLISNI
ncbi:MAG: hypothetical protein ACO3NI_17310, partial [bacterium]